MRLSRLPLKARLVAGFAGAMVIVLLGAGAFVFWRVQFALDHRLNEDLAGQTDDLRAAAVRQSPAAAIASLRGAARDAQLLTPTGRILASGPGLTPRGPLLTPAQAARATRATVRTGHGNLFSDRGRHLRILARPVPRAAGRTPLVAVTAVRLDQRDEALRELLVQLAVANLLALALASAVGYRLARAALDPVERYRAQAERITHGATDLRLDVPAGHEDEITRLGETLNGMLDAQRLAAQRQQQFIDDASHELRTPLSSLSAEIDLALRKPRTAGEYELTLQRMALDTTQLVGLAGTLLSLGALGSSTPAATSFPAPDLVHGAARRARGQRDAARTVRAQAPEGLLVTGDRELLDRALGNLVDNAIRHGAGAVTVTAASVDPPASGVVLAVHDEGPGIPAAFLPHAAERFRQARPSRTGEGAGLGLSLVDAILTAHHGQLRVCAAGFHHHGPTPDQGLRQVPCRHPEAGTTISLLLPGAAAGT